MNYYFPSHGHDDGSCLGTGADGGGKPIQRALQAKRLDMPALGVTNHSNIYTWLAHVKACQQVGIKPVLGIELYHMPVFAKLPTKDDIKKNGWTEEQVAELKYQALQYHLTILVMGNTGLKNVYRMLTEASREYFYKHPVVDNALLEKYSEGLICLSGCMGGYIAQHILTEDVMANKAFAQMQWFQRVFGDRFYLEVMPHNLPGQEDVNRKLEVWGDIYKIPVVMTDDNHYPDKQRYTSYQVLRQIRNYPETVDFSNFYMHSEDEMIDMYMGMMHVDKATAQRYAWESGKIADRCNVTFDNTLDIPQVAGVDDPIAELKKRCLKGLVQKRKYTVGADKKKYPLPEYKKRLDYELKAFLRNPSIAMYMLIAASLPAHARTMGYEAQGRGSVCNSLVAWLIGIHRVDPIRYGLIFDRFYGPERVSLPDIDIDIPHIYRTEMIAWMQQEYHDAVPVATFGTYKSQSLCNRLIALLPIENGDGQRFRDAIAAYNPADVQPNRKAMLQGREDYNSELRYLETKYRAVTHYCWLWGQISTISTHAAGVVMSSHAITDKLAVVRSHDDKKNIVYATCYDNNKSDLENMLGLLKMDVLNLNTLTIVLEAEAHAGVKYTDVILTDEERATRHLRKPFLYDDVDLASPEVMYEFYERNTLGIMQMETEMPMRYLKQLPPEDVAGVALISALNRPMAKGLLAQVVAWKQGEGPQPIIYQQDVMRRCRLAGLSWAQIDVVLKALKKKLVLPEDIKEIFIQGLQNNEGMTEAQAIEAWEQFDGYGFEEGHTFAYALLSCRMMWLKRFHKFSFYLALLRHADKDNRMAYEAAAARDGIRLAIPSVNGDANYRELITEEWVKDDGTVVPERHYIQQGLMCIDGISNGKAPAIVAERLANGEYTSRIDFCGETVQEQPKPKLRKKGRVPQAVANVAVVKALEDAGALCFDGGLFLRSSRRFTDIRREQPAVPLGQKDWSKYRRNGNK